MSGSARPRWSVGGEESDVANPAIGASQSRNAAGIASLVIGVVAIVSLLAMFEIFLLGNGLSLVLGLIACWCGSVGLSRVRRGEATGKAAAIAGTVLGAVACVASVALVFVVLNTVELFK